MFKKALSARENLAAEVEAPKDLVHEQLNSYTPGARAKTFDD
jgi:type IV pilus biogenesis protein CpaD/CtpE